MDAKLIEYYTRNPYLCKAKKHCGLLENTNVKLLLSCNIFDVVTIPLIEVYLVLKNKYLKLVQLNCCL